MPVDLGPEHVPGFAQDAQVGGCFSGPTAWVRAASDSCSYLSQNPQHRVEHGHGDPPSLPLVFEQGRNVREGDCLRPGPRLDRGEQGGAQDVVCARNPERSVAATARVTDPDGPRTDSARRAAESIQRVHSRTSR